MIESKKDYLFYIKEDQKALRCTNRKRPRIFSDEIWKFERLLRKTEYYHNVFGEKSLRYLMVKLHFKRLSIRLGFSIPINVFGPGLSIAHYGTIVVNGKARVGANCRIQADTLIGGNIGENGYPIIGNHCYIGTGAKIFGDISIGDHVKIGANAVVNKSFGSNLTLCGVPAKVVSRKEESSE